MADVTTQENIQVEIPKSPAVLSIEAALAADKDYRESLRDYNVKVEAQNKLRDDDDDDSPAPLVKPEPSVEAIKGEEYHDIRNEAGDKLQPHLRKQRTQEDHEAIKAIVSEVETTDPQKSSPEQLMMVEGLMDDLIEMSEVEKYKHVRRLLKIRPDVLQLNPKLSEKIRRNLNLERSRDPKVVADSDVIGTLNILAESGGLKAEEAEQLRVLAAYGKGMKNMTRITENMWDGFSGPATVDINALEFAFGLSPSEVNDLKTNMFRGTGVASQIAIPAMLAKFTQALPEGSEKTLRQAEVVGVTTAYLDRIPGRGSSGIDQYIVKMYDEAADAIIQLCPPDVSLFQVMWPDRVDAAYREKAQKAFAQPVRELVVELHDKRLKNRTQFEQQHRDVYDKQRAVRDAEAERQRIAEQQRVEQEREAQEAIQIQERARKEQQYAQIVESPAYRDILESLGSMEPTLENIRSLREKLNEQGPSKQVPVEIKTAALQVMGALEGFLSSPGLVKSGEVEVVTNKGLFGLGRKASMHREYQIDLKELDRASQAVADQAANGFDSAVAAKRKALEIIGNHNGASF